MSILAKKLCSLILQEYFGDNVRIVGDDLFSAKSKTLAGVCVSTKLSRSQVSRSLAILIQYRLVKFKPLELNDNLAEYILIHDRILLFERYPRYIYFIQKKYGNPSALVIEELLKSGMATAHSAIVRAYANSDVKSDTLMKEFRDSFNDLLCDQFIFRCPEQSEDPVPIEKSNLDVYKVPDIELKDIKSMIERGVDVCENGNEKTLFTVNFDKFHQCFRDKVLVDVIERQIDANAAECFQFVLQLMYNKTDAWAATTNPIAFSEIKHLIEKKSSNNEVVKYVDQYISIIEKDVCGFLNKIDDAGYGMYSINMKNAFKQIAWSVIENVITQKYGSKAARIFRVVRSKKFIEQDDIQREAMIPAKEARLYTYKLMEENYLQIQTIKKTAAGQGPTKPFFLFHVNQQQIVRDLIETSYKALYNSKVRVIQDKEANKRLMEKAMRLQFIVEQLKERGESDETIQDINETLTPPEKEVIENTKMRLKRLESSEVMIDEMIFLLQLYINYHLPVGK